MESRDVVVLGGGLCGLAAASQLGERAMVLERNATPGGLVRSVQLGDWWFDVVLHLLYFWDSETERIIGALLGSDLASCPPVAFVETPHGTTRYPFQLHLGSLDEDARVACLRDFVAVAHGPQPEGPPPHFEALLEQGFGRGMCEAFLFPYNRKMWRRPLTSLAPNDFKWNIPRPDVEQVIRGALRAAQSHQAYNAAGWYPRPQPDSPVRGMEVLTRALADQANDVRCGWTIRSIDLAARTVTADLDGVQREVRFGAACLSTIPLPAVLSLCSALPEDLEHARQRLVWNRVVMVYIAVRGPRPDSGHWRYYGDESLCFTRLVFMHAFDPSTAPHDGWGLMAEIPERAQEPLGDLADRVERALADARRVGVLGDAHEVVATTVRCIDPAYVAFTHDSAPVMERARAYLREHDITPLGRYGRWEYSSMAQVMRDGFTWGRATADRLGHVVTSPLRWSTEPDVGSDA